MRRWIYRDANRAPRTALVTCPRVLELVGKPLLDSVHVDLFPDTIYFMPNKIGHPNFGINLIAMLFFLGISLISAVLYTVAPHGIPKVGARRD